VVYWSEFLATDRRCIVLPVRYKLNLYIYIYYVEKSRPSLWSSGQSSWLQNRDVLCFLWGTDWIYICYVEESKPPLWSSGQSSLLIEELLGRSSSGDIKIMTPNTSTRIMRLFQNVSWITRVSNYARSSAMDPRLKCRRIVLKIHLLQYLEPLLFVWQKENLILAVPHGTWWQSETRTLD
jgi:hypothetical protein